MGRNTRGSRGGQIKKAQRGVMHRAQKTAQAERSDQDTAAVNRLGPAAASNVESTTSVQQVRQKLNMPSFAPDVTPTSDEHGKARGEGKTPQAGLGARKVVIKGRVEGGGASSKRELSLPEDSGQPTRGLSRAVPGFTPSPDPKQSPITAPISKSRKAGIRKAAAKHAEDTNAAIGRRVSPNANTAADSRVGSISPGQPLPVSHIGGSRNVISEEQQDQRNREFHAARSQHTDWDSMKSQQSE